MSKSIYNLFLVVVIIFLYISVISPLYNGGNLIYTETEGISSLKQKQNDYIGAVNNAKQLLGDFEKFKSKYSSIESSGDMAKLNVMLPEEVDPVRLVNEVSGIVNNSGFILNSISYSKGKSSMDSKFGADSYVVSITSQGDYTKLEDLLRNFESSLRLYEIKSLSFVSNDKPGDLMSFKIELETNYLK